MRNVNILTSALILICLFSSSAQAASVAVFPLMDISGGHNDVNLPFTEVLADRLDSGGNEIVDIKTVITFMANNRIRTIGHLETYNIFRARDELGVAFILLGTIIQRKEKPEPSLGLTLNLVRTSDDRIVWSYVGGVSRGEQRKVMGIGEPKSAEDLEPILLAEIMEQWPWKIINSVQQAGLINIDTIVLDPRHVRPGDEVHSRVRLRQTWLAGQDPRVFFKADNQLYPAEIGDDGQTYEASWVAGEENGRYSVFLLLE